jgi:hypothetical protein
MNEPAQSDRPSGLNLWQGVALFFAACAVVVARRPDGVFHPQFYAEDGSAWFADAYNLGWWPALLRPYTGYFLTAPRLAGALAQLVPFIHAPLLLNLVDVCILALPVSLLLSSRSAAWGSLRFRLLLAALYLAIPNCGEISFGITESGWHLAFVSFLLLVASVPRTLAGRALDLALLLIAGLSGPFCIFLLPIALIVAFTRKDKRRWAPAAVVGFCCVIQLFSLLVLDQNGRPHHPIGASLDLFARIVGGRVVFSALVGINRLPATPGSGFLLLFVCFAVLGVAIVGACLLESTSEMRLFLLFSSLVFAASLVSITPPPPPQLSTWQVLVEAGGARYWFFPTLAFVWALAACTRSRMRLVKTSSVLLLVLTIVGIVRDWRIPAFKDLHFAEQVERFEQASPGTTVVIPENPEGWTLSLIKR